VHDMSFGGDAANRKALRIGAVAISGLPGSATDRKSSTWPSQRAFREALFAGGAIATSMS